VTNSIELCRYHQSDDKIILDSHTGLETGNNYYLALDYEGALKGNLLGFYKSDYTDEQGQKHWIAVTHVEPYGARHVRLTTVI
jgi:hypothetical protein